MSLADIQDQDVVVRLLRRILRRRRHPNAMLFCGPAGVGKRATAYEFAKAVHCAACEDDACGECLPCRKVAHRNHPDVRIAAPTKKSRVISVDQINELNELASLRPFESEWRVIIVEDADRMNASAQNHFLKTLEEPPGNTLFILLSEYPRMLLPTIRSRCQVARFHTLRPETVMRLLARERDLAPETAEAIAALAQGQMSRALMLVDTDLRAEALDLVERLVEGADPVTLAEETARAFADRRKRIDATIGEELGLSRDDIGDYPDDEEDEEGEEENGDRVARKGRGVPVNDASLEDRIALKDARMALIEATLRRDIMEQLYLLETWYRDEMVLSVTGDRTRLLNRDRADRLAAKRSREPEAKIAAIESTRVLFERHISDERVFRELFFALAMP